MVRKYIPNDKVEKQKSRGKLNIVVLNNNTWLSGLGARVEESGGIENGGTLDRGCTEPIEKGVTIELKKEQ